MLAVMTAGRPTPVGTTVICWTVRTSRIERTRSAPASATSPATRAWYSVRLARETERSPVLRSVVSVRRTVARAGTSPNTGSPKDIWEIPKVTGPLSPGDAYSCGAGSEQLLVAPRFDEHAAQRLYVTP